MTTQRISTQTLYDSVASSIASRSQQILKLQVSVADGRALRKPSDDPVQTHQAMWYREQTRAAEQYQRTLDMLENTMSATAGTLNNMTDVLSEVRDLQVRGANDVLEGDARQSYAAQVDQDLEHLVSLANDRFNDTYTFGGRRTSEVPYRVERNAAGKIIKVAANPGGIGGAQKRQVGPDVVLTVNVRGNDLFGDSAATFQSLIKLRDALESNDGDAVRAMSAPLDGAVDRLVRASSAHGALVQRVSALRSKTEKDLINYEQGRSQAEDLDVAKATVELQREQVALQAALQSGARILNLSLLDYLD